MFDYSYGIASSLDIDVGRIRMVREKDVFEYLLDNCSVLLKHDVSGLVLVESSLISGESFSGLNYISMYDFDNSGSVQHLEYFLNRSQNSGVNEILYKDDNSIVLNILGTIIKVVKSDKEDVLELGEYTSYIHRDDFDYCYKLLDMAVTKSKRINSVIDMVSDILYNIGDDGCSECVVDIESGNITYIIDGNNIHIERIGDVCSIQVNEIRDVVNVRSYLSVKNILYNVAGKFNEVGV